MADGLESGGNGALYTGSDAKVSVALKRISQDESSGSRDPLKRELPDLSSIVKGMF